MSNTFKRGVGLVAALLTIAGISGCQVDYSYQRAQPSQYPQYHHRAPYDRSRLYESPVIPAPKPGMQMPPIIIYDGPAEGAPKMPAPTPVPLDLGPPPELAPPLAPPLEPVLPTPAPKVNPKPSEKIQEPPKETKPNLPEGPVLKTGIIRAV